MRKVVILFFISLSLSITAQNSDIGLETVLRLNIISPGVEFEMPLSKKSTISLNGGIGLNSTYLHLEDVVVKPGPEYFIAPFIDIAYKKIYNREKRVSKGKNTEYNSGNFWGIRLLSNLKGLYAYNIGGYDNIDFEVGPVWGIQRAYGKFHLLFSTGMVYYFDTRGNGGFFPITVQLNIGYNCKKW